VRLQRKFKKSLKHCTIWQNHFSIIVGSVTLLIERLPFWRNQDSINIIWNLKAKPAAVKMGEDRLLSSEAGARKRTKLHRQLCHGKR
jgi:hypothetical protein